MQGAIRKRVNRVGSGAYSIYLPKKWIDSWLPEQMEGREVDLHRISDALLIRPAIMERSLEASVPEERATVATYLLSAYVQGYRVVRLQPMAGAFDTETQILCRDVLRHTDERIVADVGPSSIGFRLDGDLPAPFQSGNDLLGVLSAKVREVVRLAAEAVEAYPHDPQRAVHAMQMLRAIHHEDVARLWHQALRLVARVELPIASITDFQVLDLLAAEMHSASEQAMTIVETILEETGHQVSDLEFPRAHLLRDWPTLPAMTSGVLGMLEAFSPAFEQMQDGLHVACQAVLSRDLHALVKMSKAMRQAQRDLQQRIFENAIAHWGDSSGATRGVTASRLLQPIDHILDAVRRLCDRAALLIAARPSG